MTESCARSGGKSLSPAREAAIKTCQDCQQFDYGFCHKSNVRVSEASTCSAWETRREIDGLTVWELLAREG
jgi:hypothetical protein